jgi:hypothetical protein
MSEAIPRPNILQKQLKLSTHGLENPASLRVNDFALNIGEEKWECSRFEASFLSPRITSLLLNDATICEFEIEIGDALVDSECLQAIISLSRNGTLTVDESTFEFVKWVAKGLGNRELSESLMDFKEQESGELNSSNAIERLSMAHFLDLPPDREIEYVASNFFEFGCDSVKSLSRADLQAILESEKLRIESEDWLLTLLLELGSEFYDFLGLVRAEYLSERAIRQLLASISLEEVSEQLWTSLARRLCLPVKVPDVLPSRHGVPFLFDSSKPFKGILSQLAVDCGGNVHMKGIVSITASSTSYNQCHQVADFDRSDHWDSKNEPNSWIQFDFKDRLISLANYTIKSDGDSADRLLRWTLAGSNDAKSWVNLDERDTQDLNGRYLVKSYPCLPQQTAPAFFRFIQLTQTGLNSTARHHLQLSNLEFFGALA